MSRHESKGIRAEVLTTSGVVGPSVADPDKVVSGLVDKKRAERRKDPDADLESLPSATSDCSLFTLGGVPSSVMNSSDNSSRETFGSSRSESSSVACFDRSLRRVAATAW